MAILRVCCWSVVALCTLWLWIRTEPRDSDAPLDGVRAVRDMAYRKVDGRPLKLDLYVPVDETEVRARPVLIAVHGGSWTGGTRRDYAPQFASLVRHGIVVVVIDYRLARPSAPSWEGALQDVLSAVDWTIENAEAWGLDRDRIAVLGTSSGGLLAARAGQEDTRIQAVVCLSTPTDLIALTAARTLRHEPARVLLGLDADFADRARQASPMEHVKSGDAPILMIHGEEDLWVPVTQARELREKLEEVCVPNRLIEIQDARHGFHLQVGGPRPRDLTTDVFDFLDESWKGSSG